MPNYFFTVAQYIISNQITRDRIGGLSGHSNTLTAVLHWSVRSPYIASCIIPRTLFELSRYAVSNAVPVRMDHHAHESIDTASCSQEVVTARHSQGFKMGLFSKAYMEVVCKDENILHLRRTPTWKSLVLFIGK